MPLAEFAAAVGKALVSAHFQRIWNPKIRFSPKFRKSKGVRDGADNTFVTQPEGDQGESVVNRWGSSRCKE